jgi:diguanylate cyclase (GGDEF)-like protein
VTAADQVEYLAYHDSLTGLPNRAAMDAALAEAIAEARLTGTAVALAYVDLNDFKRVNDSLGHDTGDRLLREVAVRLRRTVRPGDMLARRGGDEFLVLLRGLPLLARAEAEAVGQRVCDSLAAPFAFGAAELLVDASIGVSVFPGDADSAAALLHHADAAMYEAKSTGGGMAVYGADTANPLERLEMAARLRRAIERGELELHHQPIWHADGSGIMGSEGLVRWRHPDLGLIPPGDFIPVAERTGVVDALGDWVLEAMCRQGAEWLAHGMQPHIGINISPRQLRRAGFADKAAAMVEAHGLEHNRFVLELTESAWSLEGSRLLPVLHDLRAKGFTLAIDDFGAGYSSLWRLSELPVQIIKVDRAFMNGVPDDPQASAVYAAILQLVETVGCDVVAEGVETAAQLAFVADLGCEIVQGFHLGRPLPAAEATAVLKAQLAPERWR